MGQIVTLGIVAGQYLVCALIAPDFEDGEGYDMRTFHAREGSTYMVAVLVLLVYSIAVNLWAALVVGVESWADQNLLLVLMLPFAILPLVVRRTWAQIISPLVLMGSVAGAALQYYPVLR